MNLEPNQKGVLEPAPEEDEFKKCELSYGAYANRVEDGGPKSTFSSFDFFMSQFRLRNATYEIESDSFWAQENSVGSFDDEHMLIIPLTYNSNSGF